MASFVLVLFVGSSLYHLQEYCPAAHSVRDEKVAVVEQLLLHAQYRLVLNNQLAF